MSVLADNVSFEPGLRDLCEDKGWDLSDLGQRLNPPASPAAVSRWARGLRSLPATYAVQMAEQLQLPESLIWRSIAEGARRHQLRQAYLAQSAPPSKPAAKRPRKTSIA